MSTNPENSPAPGREQRRAVRYPVVLDITVEGRTGRTRDMSAGGVYFITSAPPTPGTFFALRVEARDFQMPSPMAVQCRCHVVRIESQDGEWGVAAAIDEVSFERAAQT